MDDDELREALAENRRSHREAKRARG